MKKRLGILLAFVVGALLGISATYVWHLKQEESKREFEMFEYGVVSSTLLGTGVQWKEYPQFRTVQFNLHGELVVVLPRGGEIVPDGLVDEAAFKEISRKTKSVTDGTTVLEYDEVTYLFERAQVKSNLANVYGAEKDATYGYELACVMENDTIVVGYIVPMCNEFHICSKEETAHWSYPQNLDFGLLKLSQTYPDKDVTQSVAQAEGIIVERIEDSYDITLRNEGDREWAYSTMVPGVEVWNQGVWMELQTLFGNPGMGSSIKPGESKTYPWTESILESLPYLAPGLYRIVVHGAFDDMETYAATESFVIE